jgi:hypothetical protein
MKLSFTFDLRRLHTSNGTMQPTLIQSTATVVLVLAVLHTFATRNIQHFSHSFPEDSLWKRLFHLLGEVELVFGLWACVLIALICFISSVDETIAYIVNLNFREPFFVFVIMAVAATRPIIDFAEKTILAVSRFLPFGHAQSAFVSCLTTGPLLGSFMTEPAAMTVTALILRDRYFRTGISNQFKYVVLATLLVNVSIGGVLTSFAAPPVLMVAGKWDWDLTYMMATFGWKSVVAIIINAAFALLLLRTELIALPSTGAHAITKHLPSWISMIHALILGLIVLVAHDPLMLSTIFLFFLGIIAATKPCQDRLKLRESLFVALFLGGLVVIGGLQDWWLGPLIRDMNHFPLFLGATILTAFTDNAALTYLGAQIEGVSESFKFALVGGAIAGGGLTVIANAPNPAAFAILQERFGPDGISAFRLTYSALIPTVVSMVCLWFLP